MIIIASYNEHTIELKYYIKDYVIIEGLSGQI